MKTTISLLFITLSIVIALYNCDDNPDDENIPSEITGQLISNSDCKNQKAGHPDSEVSDTLSCVEYSLDKNSHVLSLTHINAGFNCCPGDLSCTITTNNDTIIVTEHEEKAQCMCDCLYDLDMKLEGILSKKYIVKFVELYAFENPILFEMDLTGNNEGSYCVTRKNYPWGMSII